MRDAPFDRLRDGSAQLAKPCLGLGA
jgi:hypothetical protein